MNIHTVYGLMFKFWRKKRMAQFEAIIQPDSADRILDVGGDPEMWTTKPQIPKQIDCLNSRVMAWDESRYPHHRITSVVGDGCQLTHGDGSYEIVFSNSVIEHVGDWERQKAFAEEVRRVGQKLWIQTPAFECPMEPHFLAPFVHWLPVAIRRRVLRWFTPWGWISKPTQTKIDETVDTTRLLRKSQVVELFPDCEVITERLLGVFPKSYIAVRTKVERSGAIEAKPSAT